MGRCTRTTRVPTPRRGGGGGAGGPPPRGGGGGGGSPPAPPPPPATRGAPPPPPPPPRRCSARLTLPSAAPTHRGQELGAGSGDDGGRARRVVGRSRPGASCP